MVTLTSLMDNVSHSGKCFSDPKFHSLTLYFKHWNTKLKWVCAWFASLEILRVLAAALFATLIQKGVIVTEA